MKKETFDKTKWMPYIIVGLILLFAFYAINNFDQIMAFIARLFGILAPLLIGILITYFIYTPHKAAEKLLVKVKFKKFTFISKHARGISTIIVFVALIGLIAVILAFLLPAIINSIAELALNIPSYIQSILTFFNNLPDDSPFASLNVPGLINEYSGTIIGSIVNLSGVGLEQAARGIAGIAGALFDIILGMFLSLYILMSRDEIAEYFTRLNNAVFKNIAHRDKVTRYMKSINSVLHTFIASKGIDAIINFTAASLVTTVFGVPYSILMGLIAGLFNFIPYIGSIISSVLISLVALITCGLSTAVPVVICMLAFQQLDGNFIEPRIMKTSLKINPILVIMAVVIGGAFMGLPGMFLGVPIAVIIKQILEEYMSTAEANIILDDSRR